MKYVDLFAGVGGFRYGIERVNPNAQCVWSNEWDKYANSVYRRHYGECDKRDITTVNAKEIPDHDLLCAGFPCQSFSVAGKRGGFDDTRGTMFFEIARILKAKKPKYLLLENVKGLLSSITPIPYESFMIIFGEEMALRENHSLEAFVPIGAWEITVRNLGNYLRTIGGLDGVTGRLKSLATQQKQITKRLRISVTELMPLLDYSEEGLDLILRQLSSVESLKTTDISTLEKVMGINGDVVLKLRKNSGVSLNPLKLSTILTETKLTIDLKTFMYAAQELSIVLFIIRQWKSSSNLWSKIKSFSRKENIYYVKTFNIILHELAELGYDLQWQVLNSKDFGVPQNRERVFIVGHLRGTPRPQVFPIEGTDKQNTHAAKDSVNVQRQPLRYLNRNQRNIDGDYAFTVDASQTSGIAISRKTGIGKKLDIAKTLNSSDWRGLNRNQEQTAVTDGIAIRRLTPVECERLQGFPDNWTQLGDLMYDPKEHRMRNDVMSDSQRYKMMGNAVTTNVVSAIAGRLL